MKDRDRAKMLNEYSENLRRYGYDPRSLGWIRGTQGARFAALAAIGDLEGSAVLDVGCGFGDLYEYLCRRGIRVGYTGVDLNEGMIAIARRRHPGARFVVADFDEARPEGRFDWAFESGVFNLKMSDHRAFVGNMLEKMYRSARKGVAADFLNGRRLRFSPGMYFPDPADIYHFCRSLSPRVVLRCDYKPTEFCVYVYRDARDGDGKARPGRDQAPRGAKDI